MSYFAKVVDGLVTDVISAEQDYIDTLNDKDLWLQTSYNTIGGENVNGGVPLRKNYAGIGYSYSKELDAFIPPRPYASWNLNESTCLWEPPFPPPNNYDNYYWDESIKNWVLYTPKEPDAPNTNVGSQTKSNCVLCKTQWGKAIISAVRSIGEKT